MGHAFGFQATVHTAETELLATGLYERKLNAMGKLFIIYETDPVQAPVPPPPPPPPQPKKPGKWAKRIAIYGLIAATLTFLTWVIRAWLAIR